MNWQYVELVQFVPVQGCEAHDPTVLACHQDAASPHHDACNPGPDLGLGVNFREEREGIGACSEADLPYEATLIDPQIQASKNYRERQPFGQVPAYKDDRVEMFESGAIVLYVAETSEALAPRDAPGRARMASWVLAALNSIEPHAQNLIHLGGSDAGDSQLRRQLGTVLSVRLAALSAWLGDSRISRAASPPAT